MVVRSVSSWHDSDQHQSTPQRLSEFPPRFSFPLLTPTPPPPHSLHGQGYARREHDEKNYTKKKGCATDFSYVSQKNDEYQYLEIDLQLMHHVKRVATQGKHPVPGCITPDAWVTGYTMQFRQDTIDWWNYAEEGKTRVSPVAPVFLPELHLVLYYLLHELHHHDLP